MTYCFSKLESEASNPTSNSSVSKRPLMNVKTRLLIFVKVTIAALSLAAACSLAWLHPRWPIEQLIGCVIFVAIGWARPCWFAVLFPATWLIADAYPWTGQLLVQEYDSLLLANVAGTLIGRKGQVASDERREESGGVGWPFVVALMVLAVAVLASAVSGWRALPASEWGDQLSVYFTQQNSLRVAKGYTWGILYAMLVVWQSGLPGRARELGRLFALGGSIGVVYVAASVLVERWLYQSVGDFSQVYRATGTVWTMHIGDQHVDAILVMGLPLLWYRGGRGDRENLGPRGLPIVINGESSTVGPTPRTRRRWWLTGIAISTRFALTLLVLYAILATMSRGTIAAAGLQILFACALIIHQSFSRIDDRSSPANRGINWLWGLPVVLMVAIGASFAVLRSEAISERFSQSAGDWQTRTQHWRKILAVAADGPLHLCLGHGAGSMPTFLATQLDRPTPPVCWKTTDAGSEVMLRGGWTLFLERSYDDIDWSHASRKSVVVRAEIDAMDDAPVPKVDFIRSYKSVLQSFESNRVTWDFARDGKDVRVALAPPTIDPAARWQRSLRAQTIAIYVAEPESVVLRQLRIEIGGESGDEPIAARSAPSDSSSPWFFTCDDHLVWRAKNVIIHTLFEQGLLGCFGLGMVWWSAFYRSDFPRESRNSRKPVFASQSRSSATLSATQHWNRGVWVTSLLGFAVVGIFATLLDTGWITAWMIALLTHLRASSGE